MRRSASEGKIEVVTVEASVGMGIMSIVRQHSQGTKPRSIQVRCTSGQGNHRAQRRVLESIINIGGRQP